MGIASAASHNTIAVIIQHLSRLPEDRLSEVLTFVEFIEYRAAEPQLAEAEDQALWAAVETNRAYKRSHVEDTLEEYASGEDFLRAVADL
jgi:hypothetical protein